MTLMTSSSEYYSSRWIP